MVLSNHGVDPQTGKQLVDSTIVRIVTTLMMLCGMYDESGEYEVKIGLPSKSGVGGGICVVGQLLIDLTGLTPARILTGYVVAGVFLQAVGVYQYVVDWGGAGATVPLTGFGYTLAKGVAKAVAEQGLLGVITGGLTAAAGGIAAAVVFGLLMAVLFRPKEKR